MADGLAISSGAWLEKDWKIGAKEVWLKGMWMDTWEWTQSVKIFLSQVSTHQKAAIMEGVLSNLVNKITWPVEMSQALLSGPELASDPGGHMHEVATGAELEVTHGSNTWAFTQQG